MLVLALGLDVRFELDVETAWFREVDEASSLSVGIISWIAMIPLNTDPEFGPALQ